MRKTAWEQTAAAILLAAALAACGGNGREAPAFATAGPVAAAKPDEFAFKHAIRVDDLQGLNETVRRNLAVVLRTDEFTESLRRSLANDEMLAPDPAQAEYELTPIFVDLRTAPVGEGVTAAQAIFDYRVTRRDSGAVLLNRRVKAEFASIADASFKDGGVWGRTLRFVGLGEPSAAARAADPDETRAPGPKNEAAREVHAAHNAVALNIRMALRHLVAASPERLRVAGEAAGADDPVSGIPETDG